SSELRVGLRDKSDIGTAPSMLWPLWPFSVGYRFSTAFCCVSGALPLISGLFAFFLIRGGQGGDGLDNEQLLLAGQLGKVLYQLGLLLSQGGSRGRCAGAGQDIGGIAAKLKQADQVLRI